MKAADHQQKLQPRDPLDAVPPPICYLMMPLKESAVPSRLAHDLRRKRVLGHGHRIRRGMALQGVEFHDLDCSNDSEGAKLLDLKLFRQINRLLIGKLLKYKSTLWSKAA